MCGSPRSLTETGVKSVAGRRSPMPGRKPDSQRAKSSAASTRRTSSASASAGERKSNPDDLELRREFEDAARSLDLDPELFLGRLAPIRPPAPVEAKAPEPAAPVVIPPSAPVVAPAPENPSSPMPAGDKVEQAGDGKLAASERIDILRSYLNRIKKDKES